MLVPSGKALCGGYRALRLGCVTCNLLLNKPSKLVAGHTTPHCDPREQEKLSCSPLAPLAHSRPETLRAQHRPRCPRPRLHRSPLLQPWLDQRFARGPGGENLLGRLGRLNRHLNSALNLISVTRPHRARQPKIATAQSCVHIHIYIYVHSFCVADICYFTTNCITYIYIYIYIYLYIYMQL